MTPHLANQADPGLGPVSMQAFEMLDGECCYSADQSSGPPDAQTMHLWKGDVNVVSAALWAGVT